MHITVEVGPEYRPEERAAYIMGCVKAFHPCWNQMHIATFVIGDPYTGHMDDWPRPTEEQLRPFIKDSLRVLSENDRFIDNLTALTWQNLEEREQ